MGKKSKTKARARHKPADPAAAARIAYQNRHNPAAWGHNAEAMELEANADVSITPPTREKTARLLRYDCFETLHIEAGALAAVRRYQADLAIRFGVEGSSRMAEHVDGTSVAEPVSQRSLAAAQRLDILADLMESPHDLPLIEALSRPMVLNGDRVNWHAVVKAMRGHSDRDLQSRAVKNAAEGVRRAWEAYDAGAMRRAA